MASDKSCKTNEILIAILIAVLILAIGLFIFNKPTSYKISCFEKPCSAPEKINAKWLFENCENATDKMIKIDSVFMFTEWNCTNFSVEVEK